MTAREFVYNTLVQYNPLTALIGGSDNPRVYAKKNMTSSIEDCPYIVYKLGNSTNMELAETEDWERQFFQVWVHDYHDQKVVADYLRIDDVIAEVKSAFRLAGSKEDGVITAIYLETSQDLNDETLGTVFRYLRFQLIKKG